MRDGEALRLGLVRGPQQAMAPPPVPDGLAASPSGPSTEAGRPSVAGHPAIEVEGLTKRYGPADVVRGISFTVDTGEIFGFLGPNGAGKSTTISMLCTLVKPTSGHARVAGADIVTERAQVRRNIGLVFQDPTLDEYLTAEENLRFHGELYGVPKAELPARLKQILEMVELWDRRHEVVQNFSGGMRRRLEIARGLLHSPRVLFLDEPTVGLDPQTRAHIWTYIETLHRQEKITILLTTHYMDEAEHCDRIAIIDHGQIVALDTPEALKETVGRDRIEVSEWSGIASSSGSVATVPALSPLSSSQLCSCSFWGQGCPRLHVLLWE